MTGPTPTTPQHQSKWANQPSRHERGYGYQWEKLRAMVLRMDGYLCQTCLRAGRPTPATAVDHIIPKSLGGDDSADNCEGICRSCHSEKTQIEAAEARGAIVKKRLKFDDKGNPIW